MFVPVLSFPTQLTRVKTELSFVAEDPWYGNCPSRFALDNYLLTLRGAKSTPDNAKESPWLGGFRRALRSEADSVTRFLPESLIELWLRGQVSTEALPALLKQMEPSLRESDYKIILRSMRIKVFAVFEVICCALLLMIALIGTMMGQAPWWLTAMTVTGTASVCWLLLYLVYFRMLFRRKRQIRWIVELIASGKSAVATNMDRSSTLPKTPEQMPQPLMPPQLPQLLFDPSLQPTVPRLISPQPMPLQTVVYPTRLEGKEIKLSRVDKQPSPPFPELAELTTPKDFRFESIMTVPEVMEPAMEPRLRRAFPELTWEDQAENRDKVCIEGTSRGTPQRIVISIVRNESAGTFQLCSTVSARDQSEAVKSVSEMIERIKSALLGWSQFHLPQFKPRPPAGIDIDQEEIVDLVFPLERGQIRLFRSGQVILLSRILLEALSVHGKILDNRAKNPEKYPDSDGLESRAARMRGTAARLLLGQAVPTGSDKDLDVELSLVREAHSLIGELLENGWAQVIQYGPGGPCASGVPSISPRRIKVHYLGRRTAPAGGSISYSGAEGEAANLGEFLRFDWWRDAPSTTALERTHPGFPSGFHTDLNRYEIVSRLYTKPEFQATFHNPEDEQFLWCGTAPHGGRVEIWSKPDEGLFGLSILAHAEVYFEIRKTIHDLLEARLVVNSVLEEILVTHAAGRDILELDAQNLTELPSHIGMLTKLRVLSLSNNQLTCLPAEIGNLSKLVELALNENCLTELTPHIGRLTNLEILLLSHNRLRALPASIGDITSLGKLNLDHNQLRRLPAEIGKLAKLRRLDIQDNRLTELPSEFAHLESLQDFDWETWESIPRKSLPPSNVRNFIAHGNPWTYPPAEIMKKQVHVIRDYLKANPINPGETALYTVYVDDNYHHGDQTYRYKVGAFSDCEFAIAACRKIVDEFFVTHRNATAQDLFDSYRMFGEDPFILTKDKRCVFSAWKYAEQRCQELAAGAIKPAPSSWDNPLLTGDGMNLERWAGPPSPEIQSAAIPRWTPPACPLPPPLPRIISTQLIASDTGSPNNFVFESIIDLPALIESALVSRLSKEFQEIQWEERAEDGDKVHIEGGIAPNPTRYMVFSIVRNESNGPFRFGITIGAQDRSEAEKVHNEVIRRLTWTLIGWSQLPLPRFRPRRAANVNWDQTVSLQLYLEGPQLTVFQPNADILISRNLVEALSLQWEVLDGWIKTMQKEQSIGNDPETREALMRGEAARVVLRQSVSTDRSNELQVPLVFMRPAHSLLGELLELGLAQVVQYGPGGRAPGASVALTSINIHYFGSYISYRAADGEARNLGEFLRLDRE